MPLKTLLGLLLGNLIWSAHPMMGKLLLADFTPAQGAWLRYTSALISFWVFLAFFRGLRKAPLNFRRRRLDWLLLALVGFASFCFSPLLQLSGLEASRAMDNALIIAMEPLITVFLAWLVLRERITERYVLSLLVAFVGFGLLAGFSPRGLELSRAHGIGNLLILLSLFGEAFYSIAGSKLVSRNSPVTVFGAAIFFGVLFLTLALLIDGQTLGALFYAFIHQMTWKSALALLWLGPLGTTATYLYWIYALRDAPVASVALTLFVQPVFGSALGYFFLGERLTLCQSLGGALILLAVFAQTLGLIRRSQAVV